MGIFFTIEYVDTAFLKSFTETLRISYKITLHATSDSLYGIFN